MVPLSFPSKAVPFRAVCLSVRGTGGCQVLVKWLEQGEGWEKAKENWEVEASIVLKAADGTTEWRSDGPFSLAADGALSVSVCLSVCLSIYLSV
eukprot:SAG22_NODE_101_length_20519_cov_15.588002_25_plen_94_part_00